MSLRLSQVQFSSNDYSNAYGRAVRAMQAQARSTVARMIKARAREFIAMPFYGDTVHTYLQTGRKPDAMIHLGKEMLRREIEAPRRFFGFGGEAPAINACAVGLFGRWLRREERRI